VSAADAPRNCKFIVLGETQDIDPRLIIGSYKGVNSLSDIYCVKDAFLRRSAKKLQVYRVVDWGNARWFLVSFDIGSGASSAYRVIKEMAYSMLCAHVDQSTYLCPTPHLGSTISSMVRDYLVIPVEPYNDLAIETLRSELEVSTSWVKTELSRYYVRGIRNIRSRRRVERILKALSMIIKERPELIDRDLMLTFNRVSEVLRRGSER